MTFFSDSGDWDVRLGRVEFRRIPWPAESPHGPATVVIRSPDLTDAVACLKMEVSSDAYRNCRLMFIVGSVART